MSEKKTFTQEEFDAGVEKATAGLKAKNEELLGEVKSAKKTAKDLEARMEALESASEDAERIKAEKDGDVQKAVAQAEAKAAKAARKLEEDLTAARSQLQRAVVDQGLTDALTKAGVKGPYLDAAKALLQTSNKIEIKSGEDGSIAAVVGDKPLTEFVTSWAQGEHGKHFITAPANAGGGAGGAKPGSGAAPKTVTRAEFEALGPKDQMAHVQSGGTVAP